MSDDQFDNHLNIGWHVPVDLATGISWQRRPRGSKRLKFLDPGHLERLGKANYVTM